MLKIYKYRIQIKKDRDFARNRKNRFTREAD